MRWELHSQVTCRNINVIYYLKCNTCDHKETYIGKTVGDNAVGFKSRINQYISDCRTGTSSCKFLIHIYHCAMKEMFKRTIFLIKYNDETKRQSGI